MGGVGEILDAHDMSEFSLFEMVQKTVAVYTDIEHYPGFFFGSRSF